MDISLVLTSIKRKQVKDKQLLDSVNDLTKGQSFLDKYLIRILVIMLTLVLLLSLFSCSWFLKNTEELHYDKAAMYFEEAMMGDKYAKHCGYDFDIERPEILASMKDEMDGNRGTYNVAEKTIRYLSGDFEVIHHEAFHHISRNSEGGPQSYACLEETGAALLSRLVAVETQLTYCRSRLLKYENHYLSLGKDKVR